MEATKKKGFWILVILIILVAIAVRIIWPAQKTEGDANLLIVNDTNRSLGSIGVTYTSLDGSQVSEHALNADESMIEKGEQLYFFGIRWPAIVTIYTDLQSREVLAQLYIEEAPEANERWQATLYDGAEGLSLSLISVPKDAQE